MRFFLALVCWLVFATRVSADGLPYQDDGELVGDFVLINATEEQFTEISTKRTLTLNKAQKQFLSRLFKRVPETLTVVSSTFNDNCEGASAFDVHCIWLRDKMIAICYDSDYASRLPEEYWNKASFTSVASPDRLILSADAKLYQDGQELSVADVYKLIDQLAAEVGGLPSPATLGISVPPKTKWGLESEEQINRLLDAFVVYGQTKGVVVGKTW